MVLTGQSVGLSSLQSKFRHSRKLICAWLHSTPWDYPSGLLVALVSFLPWMVALSLSRCCATSFESSAPGLHGCFQRMKIFGSTNRWPTRWLFGQWFTQLPTMSTSSVLSVLVSIYLHNNPSRLNWLQSFDQNLHFRSITLRPVVLLVTSCFSLCFWCTQHHIIKFVNSALRFSGIHTISPSFSCLLSTHMPLDALSVTVQTQIISQLSLSIPPNTALVTWVGDLQSGPVFYILASVSTAKYVHAEPHACQRSLYIPPVRMFIVMPNLSIQFTSRCYGVAYCQA